MLTIGRVGLDVTLDDPESIAQSGEEITITGVLDASSITDAKVLRQQLLGLVNNPDEPFVPVIWDQDSHLDGFYQVTSAQMSTIPASYTANWFPFTAVLARIADYAAPVVESRLLAPGIRDNDLSLTESELNTCRHVFALPDTAVGREGVQSAPIVVCEDGDDMRFQQANNLQDLTVEYLLTAADWYSGACRVLFDYANNGTYRTVVGRQAINLVDTGRWYLSNGVIRLSLEDATDFIIGLSRWDGAAWTTTKLFEFTRATDDSVIPAPDTITILRNGPQEATIRLTGGGLLTGAIAYRADFRLVRGARHFEVTAARVTSAVFDWQLGRESVDAGTVLDISGSAQNVGIYDATDDADGLTYFIVTPQAHTPDTTNGRVALGNESLARFGFGLGDTAEWAGSEILTARTSAQEYFGAMSETVRLVER